MSRDDFRFSFPKRIRYAEIDGQMIVFNARYLEYADIGITEYWRAVGIALSPAKNALEFNVAKAVIEYKAPIRLEEVIDLCIRVNRIGRSSMTTFFEFHGEGRNDLRAYGEIINVHVGLESGRPEPLPQHIVDAFERYESRALRAD